MADRVVLLTGFEPYGGRGLNPAFEIVRRLDGADIAGVPVVGRSLPVSYRELRGRIDGLLDQFDPAVVIGLGLWPGAPLIRLERIAINVADFEIVDNDGAFVTDMPVEGNAATALLATLPLRQIEQALLDAEIPARVSNTAGTFLCNATLFEFLHGLAGRGRSTACGFIHVPYLPAQVAELLSRNRSERKLELEQRADLASMDLDVMVQAVRTALQVCLAPHA
jgi:pyroglutamyl-peptidase